MKINSTVLFMWMGLFFLNSPIFAQSNKRQTYTAPVVYTTTADQHQLLVQQPLRSIQGPITNAFPVLELNPEKKYQSIDGFGFTLTGGSAYLINKMKSADKSALLNELFGHGKNSIGISYLRISIGASDLSSSVYSYDDVPAGQTDSRLLKFSLAQDKIDLIPILKQILLINPAIKIMATPWSPPVWMKDNHSTKGGHLLKEFYGVYAEYFVRYIQEMKKVGIQVDAITIQNEPHHGGNNPSMVMEATEEATFIKNHLGPAFKKHGIKTKIIVWDHNCDEANYPIQIFKDSVANRYIDGAAFHLYNGDISALSVVHTAYPQKNLYFTEQWTGKSGTFKGDLMWHMKNVIIGSMNNWSRNALEWNLANDPDYAIHTPGGCTECKGALTISGSGVSRNVSYYIVAHASKFVPAGSIRIETGNVDNLSCVAFLSPSGKKILIVLNESMEKEMFNIKLNGNWILTSMLPSSVSTFVL